MTSLCYFCKVGVSFAGPFLVQVGLFLAPKFQILKVLVFFLELQHYDLSS